MYREARARRGVSLSPSELWYAIDSDRAFRFPAMRLAEVQAAHQPDTFAYLFTWVSPFMEGALGSCHALEIPFVFGTFELPMVRRFCGDGPDATALSDTMQEAWLTFAHSGRPGHTAAGEWAAYEPTRRATMLLGREPAVSDAPFETERAFWDSVYPLAQSRTR